MCSIPQFYKKEIQNNLVFGRREVGLGARVRCRERENGDSKKRRERRRDLNHGLNHGLNERKDSSPAFACFVCTQPVVPLILVVLISEQRLSPHVIHWLMESLFGFPAVWCTCWQQSGQLRRHVMPQLTDACDSKAGTAFAICLV